MEIVENCLSIKSYNELRKSVGWCTFSHQQVEKALSNRHLYHYDKKR